MKSIALAIGMFAIAISSSLAGLYQPEGELFHPTAPIIWSAANDLPKSLTVFKVSQGISEAAISNTMAIGSFKPLNKIHSANGDDLIVFQDHRDKGQMTRYLKISPATAWLNYYDAQAGSGPPKNVPSFDEVERLATNYLSRLGGDVHQLVPKPWMRSEQTVTTFTKNGGEETGKAVSMRGVFLYRQMDGIPEPESKFWINFVNDAKPSVFEMKWKQLSPLGRYAVAATNEILSWISAGKAVRPTLIYGDTGNEDVSAAKKFTITAISPFLGTAKGTKDIVSPFGKIEITADLTETNTVHFFLNCPILSTNIVRTK